MCTFGWLVFTCSGFDHHTTCCSILVVIFVVITPLPVTIIIITVPVKIPLPPLPVDEKRVLCNYMLLVHTFHILYMCVQMYVLTDIYIFLCKIASISLLLPLTLAKMSSSNGCPTTHLTVIEYY